MKRSADVPIKASPALDLTSDEGSTERAGGKSEAQGPPEEIPVGQRVNELVARMAQAPPGLAKNAQEIIGRIAVALPGVAAEKAAHLLDILGVAVSGLLADPPNVRLARRILDGVERQLLLRRKIRYLMMGLGIGLLVTLALTVAAFLIPRSAGFDPDELGLVSLAGFVGASVSLATKIKDYSQLTTEDTRVLLYTGLFKPLVGMAFALFVYMVLSSGIIEMGVDDEKRRFFFVAVAFVAGFSERFAKDVISKVEQTASPQQGDGSATGESQAEAGSGASSVDEHGSNEDRARR